MEKLTPLKHEQLCKISGGFIPVVIFGVTYSAKAVAAYFGAVSVASSGIALAVIGDNNSEPIE